MGVVGAAIFACPTAGADAGTAAGAAAMQKAGVKGATQMHALAVCMLRKGGFDWGNIAARIQSEFPSTSGAEAYQAAFGAVYAGCPQFI